MGFIVPGRRVKNKRIRVLFLIPSLRGGGAERVVTNVLRGLDCEKFIPTLVVVNSIGAVFTHDVPAHVEIVDLGSSRVRHALPAVARLIWARRPDVVFTTLGHLNLALALLRPLLPDSCRYLARETSIVSLNVQSYRVAWAWRLLYRWLYRRFDRVICQSRFMARDLCETFAVPNDKLLVINNPVDITRVRELAVDSSNVPAKQPGIIQFVAAGRLSSEKGFDLLIDAIALLHDANVHVWILGTGPLHADLLARAHKQGIAHQVSFVGFQANPYAWFSAADAFLLPSRYEGFPNVVIEALACGTPVIATPSPGGTLEILDRVAECVVATESSASALRDALAHWVLTDRRRVPLCRVMPYGLETIVAQYENSFE